MKFTEATAGRIFILRLEHGDQIPETIETFAQQQKISAAIVWFVGGAQKDSKIVVGPEDGTAAKPIPVVSGLPGVSEAVGVGTIFTNEAQLPTLHMHSAFGRGTTTITGCTREGVHIWHIGEVVIMELADCTAQRKVHPATGFELLEI